MQIYFVRHGDSQANLLHEISNRGLRHGLTPKGRVQAESLAQQLQNLSITRIYSSPLLRAIETSVILANHLNVDYDVVDALCEYDCGVLEGRNDEAAWRAWKELFDSWAIHKRWEQKIAGGESFEDIRSRFTPFIEALKSKYGDTDESVLCVAHGGIYWMMLPLVLNNVSNEILSKHKLDYTTLVVSELCSGTLTCTQFNGEVLER